ncbi:hypothetical protein FWK35_00010699 [Aphis craccivora]|uniref:Uncharacterized protein n=1 Tax=Aphis craccivora TaxID=307492 RepID=A0A6G0YTN1_APHCR|nr:hypothetical protein FWK35_00010699 [Aphis craccivora]
MYLHVVLRKTIQTYFFNYLSFILDTERSDECIDSTMIITIQNNFPVSNFGEIESKHFPTVFNKIEKNK